MDKLSREYAEELAKEHAKPKDNGVDRMLVKFAETNYFIGYMACAEHAREELQIANELNNTLRDQVKQWEKVPGLKQLREENERLSKALNMVAGQLKIHIRKGSEVLGDTYCLEYADKALNQQDQ